VKRVGFVLKVRKEKIEEYKKRHLEVWPAMLDALSRAGWHNYSLFIRNDGTLFGYFETPESFQTALRAMEKEGVNSQWQEAMKPYFETLEGGYPDERMMELDEVFHLD